jgi:TRAP transporter TAXI family solute receptor
MKRVRLIGVLALGLIMVLSLAVPGIVSAQGRNIVTCASGSTGGGFYLLGSGLATILQKNIPNVVANNQATTGAAENVRLVGDGMATVGLAGGDHMYFGYRGGREFDKPRKDIRLLIGTYTPTQHIVVHADLKVNSIADLKGKRIGTTPGFNASECAPAILEAYGVKKNEVKIVPMAGAQVLEAYQDRKVDAFILGFGAPHPLITQALKITKSKFLNVDPAKVKALLEKYPYWIETVVEKGDYQGLDQDYHAIMDPVAWVVNAKAPDELVYQMVKTIIEHNSDYQKIYREAKEFNTNNALKLKHLIPLHPGAEKYYKEKGLLK